MRTKLLMAIACLLSICIGFSSCLKGSDEGVNEVNISTVVTAFGIDTIQGRYYKFSIDQLNHVIFNADSLPVGAEKYLGSIAIDTFSASGYITSGLLDSLVMVGGKVDLTPAVNQPGITFKIVANDGSRSQNYNLQINVHKLDPDSATWKNIAGLPDEIINMPPQADQKMLMADGHLVALLNSKTMMVGDVTVADQYSWAMVPMSGLPDDALIHSALYYDGLLYMISESGDVYNSEGDGVWTINETLSGGVKTLLASFSDKLTAIREVEGEQVFCLTTSATESWTDGVAVPAAFPTDRVYSSVYVSGTGVERAILVGNADDEAEMIVPWMTIDGDDWGEMSTNTDYYCPAFENPSVLCYNEFFYVIGNGLETMYESLGGIVWGESVGKFRLPEDINGNENYAVAVDVNDYIWLFTGDGQQNQLWRGRLNKLSR